LVLPGATAKANASAIRQAAAAFESGELPAIILPLSLDGYRSWLPHIDAFPRVHVRKGLPEKSSTQLVVGVVKSNDVSHFQDVFGCLGAGFLPADGLFLDTASQE